VRRLWRRGRVGRERGIAGGLDGEARSAFGEQELAVNNHHPNVSTNVAGTPSTKKKRKGDSRTSQASSTAISLSTATTGLSIRTVRV
jgi:hypothetical protein